jgi:acyl carrier protein
MGDEQELRDMVAEILEAEPGDLLESSELESFATYDSVARLSLMVALSDFIGRPVMVPELMELHTYADVVRFAKASSKNGNHA